MVDTTAAASGGGGGFLGAAAPWLLGGSLVAGLLGGKSKEKKEKRNLARALEAQRIAEERRQRFADQAAVQDGRGLQDIRGGFAGALAAQRAAGGAVRQQARTSGQSLQGRAQMASFDRGLVGTSGGRAMTAAAQREASRGMAGIEGQLAQLEAQLGVQGGQAMARQRGVISNRFMQRGQAARQHGQDQVNLRGNIQYTDGLEDLSKSVLGLGGAFLGNPGIFDFLGGK